MIFGGTVFTFVHVALSLIGILAGFIALIGWLTSKSLPGWNAIFLITTALTSITGFLFPSHKFLPSHAFGLISLVALALAFPALSVYHLAGSWRRIYVITAIIALYLNVFVLIAQLFGKVPALKALAPTQKEPPFLVSQLVVLILFVAIGTLAIKRSRLDAVRAA